MGKQELIAHDNFHEMIRFKCSLFSHFVQEAD